MRTHRALVRVVVIVVLATVAAGCGESEPATTTTAAATTTTSPTTTAAPTTTTIAAPATTADATTTAAPTTSAGSVAATITISGFSYGQPVSVAVGDTIRVTNDDPFPHTWTADDGAFSSGSIGFGDSYEFTFDAPGEYTFYCSFHPEMAGSLTVEG